VAADANALEVAFELRRLLLHTNDHRSLGRDAHQQHIALVGILRQHLEVDDTVCRERPHVLLVDLQQEVAVDGVREDQKFVFADEQPLLVVEVNVLEP